MFRSRYSDRLIDVALLVISVFGVVMIGSASVDQTGAQGGLLAIKNMFKQSIFVFGGIVVMLFIKRFFKTSWINRHSLKIAYVLIAALMLFCLMFENEHGGHSWIPIFGVFSLQPAEFAKLLVMAILAYYMVDVAAAIRISPRLSYEKKLALSNHHLMGSLIEFFLSKYKLIQCLILPLVLCAIILVICIVFQKDLGTGAIILGIVVVCFFSANNRYYRKFQKPAFKLLCVVVVLGLLAIPLIVKAFDGYRIERLITWLDPLWDPLGKSYQQINGLIAFAQNGLWGKGLGNSTQKFGYIPEAYNDYIVAIIFEELGVLGLALVIIPYTIIIWRLFYYSFRVSDGKAKIMLCGIGSYFFFHLLLNLGGVSGLIPMTGVPLLCVSMGGSSTLSAFMAIGIAQAIIWRYNKDQISRLS